MQFTDQGASIRNSQELYRSWINFNMLLIINFIDEARLEAVYLLFIVLVINVHLILALILLIFLILLFLYENGLDLVEYVWYIESNG